MAISPWLRDQPYVESLAPGTAPGSVRDLDLYLPEGAGSFPLLIWIHGGGWHSGDKEQGSDLARWFVPFGFAVASLNYRLTVDTPFPAQAEDCFAALAWLRCHAGAHRLNPDKIGIMGLSAGAHLAALLMVGGGPGDSSSASNSSVPVQAVALWAGPFDLARERGGWPPSAFVWNPRDPFCRTFFPGGDYDEKLARQASPCGYVRPGLPPTLIIHGAKDATVPSGQASAFAEALREAGNSVSFRIDPEAGHDLYRDRIFERTRVFFQRTLQGIG